jgi:hypothetical protein
MVANNFLSRRGISGDRNRNRRWRLVLGKILSTTLRR